MGSVYKITEPTEERADEFSGIAVTSANGEPRIVIGDLTLWSRNNDGLFEDTEEGMVLLVPID